MKVPDIAAVFSNVETILELHVKLKERFNSLNDNWPLIDDLSDVILKMVGVSFFSSLFFHSF
jgi:hypothetical protein